MLIQIAETLVKGGYELWNATHVFDCVCWTLILSTSIITTLYLLIRSVMCDIKRIFAPKRKPSGTKKRAKCSKRNKVVRFTDSELNI